MNEISAVLAERGKRYGEFPEHARITQSLKRAMSDSPNWAKLPDYQKEALEMVAHKIGRMLNGDFMYEDNLVDLIGYTQLALDETRTKNQVGDAASGQDVLRLAKHAEPLPKPKKRGI